MKQKENKLSNAQNLDKEKRKKPRWNWRLLPLQFVVMVLPLIMYL